MSEQPFQILRSLVGMTMGCRKRVVRARCWEAGYTLRRNRFSLTSDQLRALDVTERAECAKIRDNYRIGQRLRPCPGCAQCLRCQCGNSASCIGLYEAWTKHQKAEPACNECCGHGCEDGHCDKVDDICDGSGVLPARAKKVRR